MIGQRLEFTINKAIKRANDLKHEFLTLENVLLSLIEDKEVSGVLENCGASTLEIKNELKNYLYDQDNFSILNDDQIDALSKKHFVDDNLRELAGKNGIKYQPELSLALQRVIQKSGNACTKRWENFNQRCEPIGCPLSRGKKFWHWLIK